MGKVIELPQLIKELVGKTKVVVTNGTFAELKWHHILMLQEARHIGNCLVVLVNDADSIYELKRYKLTISDSMRYKALAALGMIDYVCPMHSTTAYKYLAAIKPKIYVKGGDYTLETINKTERKLLEHIKAQIYFTKKHDRTND